MKQAARKIPQLSIVPSQQKAGRRDSADSLDEFFGGWLDSVAPDLSRETPPKTPRHASGFRKYSISSTDIVRVNRATVRESTNHRHWPPEVVAQFLAAEVIRKNGKST
jgi:hypothetical protein